MDRVNFGGDDIPKQLLKTIIYSGLNGAGLKGRGSIRNKVRDAFGEICPDQLS